MDKELLHLPMETNTLENIKMVREMDKELPHMPMETPVRVYLRIISVGGQ
jgi:hypothetical protein